MAEITWTPKLVESRLEEAADTLRRLPEPRIQACRSGWPQIIREFYDAYGSEPVRLRLGPPSAVAIDRMDQTLAWLRWLEPDDARIVWLRACGVRWRLICQRIGVSRTTAWQTWVAGLILIASRLEARQGAGIILAPHRRAPKVGEGPLATC